MKPIVYVMVGSARSGKSTYYEDNLSHLEIVSRDIIRKDVFGAKDNMDNEKEVTAIFNCKMEKLFKKGNSFVIDNTSLKKRYRKEFILKAVEHGFNAVAVYMNTSMDTCLKRARKTNFPSRVIYQMFDAMEVPTEDEGFMIVHEVLENDKAV